MDFFPSFSLWNSRLFSLLTTWKLKFSRSTNSRFPTIAEDPIQPNYAAATTTRWSEIQTDVLELVLKKLALADILRSGAVCSSWKTAVSSYISSPLYYPLPTPHLMLHGDESDDIQVFFNVTETKFYNVKITLVFHDPDWITESSDGLLWYFYKTGDIVLVNPTLGDEFQLPSMSSLVTFENTCDVDVLCKVFLSSNPHRSENFSVAIVYMRNHVPALAFCRYGDQTWTWTQLLDQSYSDIVRHNDQIHALSTPRATVDIWDSLSPFPKKVVEFGSCPEISEILLHQWPLPLQNQDDDIYLRPNLAKSMGEVLNIEQYLLEEDDNSLSTIGFIVYRFDYGERSWEPIQALPDHHHAW